MKRKFSVKACEDLDMLFLSKEDLANISLDFRKEVHELFEHSNLHLSRLNQMIKRG